MEQIFLSLYSFPILLLPFVVYYLEQVLGFYGLFVKFCVRTYFG